MHVSSATSFARRTFAVLGTAALFIASNRPAAAQAPAQARPTWEFLISNGGVMPTGAQRSAIKRGKMTAAQLSYMVNPTLALTATVGWARSRDITISGDPKLDVFTYDVGAELRSPRMSVSNGVTLKPFAGIGAGARSYNYRSLDFDATHNLAAYGSAGGEIGIRRIRLRMEARDYITGFKPLAGAGDAATRNDVVVLVGLRFSAR